MEIKMKKAQKSAIKGKLKFEGYKNYLEAAQFENKPFTKKKKLRKIDVDNLKGDQKEFIK